MQEVLRIGDQFVPANDDVKDIGKASTEITDIVKKYNADLLAVVGKGEGHNLVTAYHDDTHEKLVKDVTMIIALIQTIAEAYNTDAIEMVDVIKIIMKEGE